mgnify:CR=1 FL=1
MVNAQSIMAMGKSKLGFKLNLLKNGLRVVNIAITIHYGIIYVIMGEIILSFISLTVMAWFNFKYVNYGILQQMKDVWLIILGGIITAIIVYLGGTLINNLIFYFIGGILSYGIIYFAFQYLINKELLLSTINLIKDQKNK